MTHNVQFIASIEPMVDESRLTTVRLQLGFDFAVSNVCSSIWLFWNSVLDVGF